METASVYAEGEQEAMRHLWIESEKAGHDLGEAGIRDWVTQHWWGFLRARWMEHLQSKRFWVELDRRDFGLLKRKFHANPLLLDRVSDRLAAGRDNLDVIAWALAWGIPTAPVIDILMAFDINGRRLAHKFGCPDRADVPLVKVDPTWLTWEGGIVQRLAWGIGADDAFDRLPILGDALEEAGCTDPAILDHCRSAAADTRWSWLVDLILWGE